MSFQKIIIVGRIATDLELKELTNTSVLNFRIAFDSGYGEKKHTIFMAVAMFGKRAESMEKYLSKGREVLIVGKLQENKWEKDGVEQSRITIDADDWSFVGSKEDKTDAPPEEHSDVEPF